MDLVDMLDTIQSTTPLNVWLLIEHLPNYKERFKMRDLFFKALKELQIAFDLPGDIWH
jgi:hypothetical protein